MDLALAKRCVRASLAAYHDPSAYGRGCNALVEVCGWESVASFFAYNDDELLIVFRGTLLARGADDADRWDTMLGGMMFNFAFAQTDGCGGRVHRGFLAALDGIWRPLGEKLRRIDAARGDAVRDNAARDNAARDDAALDNGSWRRLVITGHSKGAALATLAAWRLWQEGRPVDAVYTFGGPRVGNAAFARSYPAPLYRFENRDDPVPHLPPPPRLAKHLRPILGEWVVANVDYQHAGELYFLDWTGRLQAPGSTDLMLSAIRAGRMVMTLLGNRRQAIADHRCEAYAAALDAVSAVGHVPNVPG
jgi:hypothetical protein